MRVYDITVAMYNPAYIIYQLKCIIVQLPALTVDNCLERTKGNHGCSGCNWIPPLHKVFFHIARYHECL